MSNLRDRLKRIKELKSSKPQEETQSTFDESVLIDKNWKSCGFKVLKQEVIFQSPIKQMKSLPRALSVLVPDLQTRALPSLEDFLFFDLETSGISGGAGTVAFLAAFGRIIDGKMRITQYLLLDYPGENDFLEVVLSEFKNGQPVIVSYNGKCFDSQIIKTRCLVNRMKPPVYFHADLLHPARRLWKNIIYDCSQGSIEAQILGIERSDDIPGSLAPDIWFEFLKTGRTEKLLGICEHNLSDILGLAGILAAMISISNDPFGSEYQYDIERLSLYWRDFLRHKFLEHEHKELRETGNELLRFAAEKRNPRAVYVYAFEQMKNGNYMEALDFVKHGLKLFHEDSVQYNILLRRQQRLEKKLEHN